METSQLVHKIPEEIIRSKIFFIRGHKVMLDVDLAELYGVETKQLKRQVRRNIDRFPGDFMFELTHSENESLRSQFGTLKQGSHTKYLPFAFTEQGIAMLSGVLNSSTAIKINIHIIRVFTKMREMVETQKDLLLKINELESKLGNHDKSIQQLFAYLKQLIHQENEPRKTIGFKP